jgi:hypothetical protein
MDSQYGVNHGFYRNAGLGSWAVREAKTNTFLFNDTSSNTYIKEHGLANYYIQATPGTYVVGSPHGGHLHNDNAWFFSRAITSLRGGNIYAFHPGDAFDGYYYFNYRGGCYTFQDECVKGMARQVNEAPAPYGTVTTGGANATTVTSNFTANNGNQGDGYVLVDTSQVLASGLMLSNSVATQPALDTMTTSDTHAVSNAWATLSGACGTLSPQWVPGL